MGPVYFCAAIYVTLSNSIVNLAPELSRFPPKFYYWAFLSCDAVSLVLQATGAGMAARTSGISDIGVSLALAGLGFQVLTILVFCVLFVDFLLRFFRSDRHQMASRWRFQAFFVFLSLALLLITIRSAFRLYELHQGFRGDSLKNEGLFIGMEGV